MRMKDENKISKDLKEILEEYDGSTRAKKLDWTRVMVMLFLCCSCPFLNCLFSRDQIKRAEDQTSVANTTSWTRPPLPLLVFSSPLRARQLLSITLVSQYTTIITISFQNDNHLNAFCVYCPRGRLLFRRSSASKCPRS